MTPRHSNGPARVPWIRHRRGRVPGRGRLRELAAQPGLLAQTANPRRLQRVAAQPLPDRLIGLMMIRDESDVLAESLAVATQWFDRILVLDGTGEQQCDATNKILASTPEVVFVARDADIDTPVRDGARQVLLDEVRRRYGVDNWIGILHADEFMEQDPRPMLSAHNPLGAPTIRVRLIHGFLHVDDQDRWGDLSEHPVRQRISHFMWPGVPETRFFFDTGTRDYEVDRHGKTVPVSFRPGPLVDGFSVLHFNERSPGQVLDRAEQRQRDNWQSGGHYQRLVAADPEVFTSSLDSPEAPLAPEFAGDPLGPFTARAAHEVPAIGPPSPVSPLFVVGGLVKSADSEIEHRADLDLRYVHEHGGLLDLVDLPGRRASVWSKRLIERPDYVAYLQAPGALELLAYTTKILRSQRTSRASRVRAAHEFVDRFTPPAAVERRNRFGWVASFELEHKAAATRLLELFPDAAVVEP